MKMLGFDTPELASFALEQVHVFTNGPDYLVVNAVIHVDGIRRKRTTKIRRLEQSGKFNLRKVKQGIVAMMRGEADDKRQSLNRDLYLAHACFCCVLNRLDQ